MEKGRGSQRSLYGDSRLSFFSMFLLFSPFLNLSDGHRTNDWLEIYEKDRKIIPLAGDSKREELGGGDSNVWDINGGASRILRVVNCRVTKRCLHTLIEFS